MKEKKKKSDFLQECEVELSYLLLALEDLNMTLVKNKT